MFKAVAIPFDDFGKTDAPTLSSNVLYAVEFPMWSVGVTNDTRDIASDRAWVLFAAEVLSEHAKLVSHEARQNGREHFECIYFLPGNLEGTRDALVRLKQMVDGKLDALGEAAVEVESSLTQYPKIHFPALGDSFLANYVNSLETHFEGQELEDIYRQHPTWRFGVWRSFFSLACDADLFASTDSWIVPRGFELCPAYHYAAAPCAERFVHRASRSESNFRAARSSADHNPPHGKRQELKESLYRHGINESVLFPDLDGLARHIDWMQTASH